MQQFANGQYLGINAFERQFNGLITTQNRYEADLYSEWHYHKNPYFAFILKGGSVEKRKPAEIECLPGMLLFYSTQEKHKNERYQAGSRNFSLEFSSGRAFCRNLPFEVALNTGQASVDHAGRIPLHALFQAEEENRRNHNFGRSKGNAKLRHFRDHNPRDIQAHRLATGRRDFQNLLRKSELKYVPQSIRNRGESATLNGYRKQHSPDKAPLFMRSLDLQKRVIKAFHDEGVRIMLGTDSSWNLHFVVAGFSVHEELLELIDAGLSLKPCVPRRSIRLSSYMLRRNLELSRSANARISF